MQLTKQQFEEVFLKINAENKPKKRKNKINNI